MEYLRTFGEYLIYLSAYVIMCLGKMICCVYKSNTKPPRGHDSWGFLFRLGRVAYSLGWLPITPLHPTICICSRLLHLP